jgi:hypothetical protein
MVAPKSLTPKHIMGSLPHKGMAVTGVSSVVIIVVVDKRIPLNSIQVEGATHLNEQLTFRFIKGIGLRSITVDTV